MERLQRHEEIRTLNDYYYESAYPEQDYIHPFAIVDRKMILAGRKFSNEPENFNF